MKNEEQKAKTCKLKKKLYYIIVSKYQISLEIH